MPLLKQACAMVLQKGDVSQGLARYTLTPEPTKPEPLASKAAAIMLSLWEGCFALPA